MYIKSIKHEHRSCKIFERIVKRLAKEKDVFKKIENDLMKLITQLIVYSEKAKKFTKKRKVKFN